MSKDMDNRSDFHSKTSEYVLLTGNYIPFAGATGICVHRLAVELRKRGRSVTVICYDDGRVQDEFVDGVKIVKIKVPSYFIKEQVDGSLTSVFRLLQSRIAKVLHLYKYPLRSTKVLASYVRRTLDIISQSTKPVVLASYVPFEAVLALSRIKIKCPNAQTVYYSADTLSNELGSNAFLPPERRAEMGLKRELAIFASCDDIILMECHKDHYASGHFDRYRSKFHFANFPLLVKPHTRYTTDSSEKRELNFIGTLYRELRNPSFSCDLIIGAIQGTNYECQFIGGGDCNDILERAGENSHGKIKYLGVLPHEQALLKVANASVLLSIGNHESPMAPSKIYEYMATGKPIIHVYSWDSDPCLVPLRQYGNSLLIKEDYDRISEDSELVKEFLLNTKVLSYQYVSSIFPSSTPEYTVDILEKRT